MTLSNKKFENELRYDRGNIEILERGDGFMRCRVSIARPGVFPYLTPSGTIRMEAKLPEDIFSEKTINSAKLAPVTDGHPPVNDNQGLVNTSNWQKYVRGSLGDSANINDEKLDLNETIFDAGLIADLEAERKLEVSIGFKTDVVYTPGEYNGKRYDAKQTNIIINHVAHVEKGRAGEDIRAYLDSAEEKIAVMQMQESKKTIRRDSKMDVKALLESIKEFFSNLSAKIEGEVKPKDGATAAEKKDPAVTDPAQTTDDKKDSADIAALKKENNELRARVDALDALTKKQTESQKHADESTKLDEAVKKRLALIDIAKSIIPDFKYDGVTDRDIMLEVIENTLPYDKGIKTDELDDIYIQARYDAALSLAREKANTTDERGSTGRIDEAAVEAKKNKRLNIMKED